MPAAARATIPALVGVDIGCGMMAGRITLFASDLPDNPRGLRVAIERSVWHGFAPKRSGRDPGGWAASPQSVDQSRN